MTKSEKYQEIILQTDEWFGKKLEQLSLLIGEDNESKILFQGNEGEQVELPDHLKKGFKLGIQTAIEILGEFPIKITKTK